MAGIVPYHVRPPNIGVGQMSIETFWKAEKINVDCAFGEVSQGMVIHSVDGKGNGRVLVWLESGNARLHFFADAAAIDNMINQLEAAGAALAMQAEQEGAAAL